MQRSVPLRFGESRIHPQQRKNETGANTTANGEIAGCSPDSSKSHADKVRTLVSRFYLSHPASRYRTLIPGICFPFEGANPEVSGKLHYFKSMHYLRAIFRGLYTVALLILATDGLTSSQEINHQE